LDEINLFNLGDGQFSISRNQEINHFKAKKTKKTRIKFVKGRLNIYLTKKIFIFFKKLGKKSRIRRKTRTC
jgi:hypothetical protein